jgi:hypothetical protein
MREHCLCIALNHCYFSITSLEVPQEGLTKIHHPCSNPLCQTRILLKAGKRVTNEHGTPNPVDATSYDLNRRILVLEELGAVARQQIP